MDTDVNLEFAARIRYVMTIKGLQNRDIVALWKKHFGYAINSSTVSQYLSGRFSPTRERAEMMGQVLGVSAIWLQGYGKVEDFQELGKDEQHKQLRRIRKIFLSLRPELQRMAIYFMQYLEIENQNDTFIFQQKMGKIKKDKNEWKYVLPSSILISEDDKNKK